MVTADQERIKRHTVPNCILGASGDCCREKISELRNTASKLETFKDDFESSVLCVESEDLIKSAESETRMTKLVTMMTVSPFV